MAQNQTGSSGGMQGTSSQHGASQNTQGMQGTSGAGTSGAQGRGMQGQAGMQSGSGSTGADDVTYDLISVAYHALQAAQTYRQYEQDASRGDQQMQQFFRKVCDDNRQCAEQALQMLQQHLGGQGGQSKQHGSQSSMHGSQSQGSQSSGSQSGDYGRGTR